MAITYPQIKTALQAADLPTADGAAWQGEDMGSYTNLYVPAVMYAAGVPLDRNAALYGIAYPGVLPQSVAYAVGNANYSVTVAGTPRVGNSPFQVTFTATETGGTATNYHWVFGDGTTQNTTTPTTTHTYSPSVTTQYAPTLTTTFDGMQHGPVTALSITAIKYSGTLAGTPLTGAHPLAVTWTVTETGGPADSYAWDFGDGNTGTSTSPSTQHTYAAAGSFTAKVTPTIDGVAQEQITATAPAVVS